MAPAAIPSGIDLSHVDPNTRPQDDLFGHVNGRWLAGHTIPDDRATDGAFRGLFDRTELQLHDLITEAAADSDAKAATDPDRQRIGDLYASFLAESAVMRRGVAPLHDELAGIEAANNADDLAAVLGGLQRSGVGGPVGLYVAPDAKDSTRYLVHLMQSGIGLPDQSYYHDARHAAALSAYPSHIATMLSLVYGGTPQAHADSADRVVALETKLAAAHWDVVKLREAELVYNLLALTDVQDRAPGFNWVQWVSALGTTPEAMAELVVGQPDYLTAFGALWTSEYFQDWKHWARWQLIHARAHLLTDPLVAEDFAFYGRTLTGTEQIPERWKRGIALVETLVGDAVGRLYVDRYFPPAAKARVEDMVAKLKDAYRTSIDNLEWMTAPTRKRALAKLNKLGAKIGYPRSWRDYSGLIIDRGDLYGNYQRAYAVDHDRQLGKLGGPVDREEWLATPQAVNAFYNPGLNEIVFPAAILQPPFFDAGGDDAANYGGIGAVIGHEIGHAFDDQGAKYDGDGNLTDWWTDEDRSQFGTRTAALIEQYDSYSPRELDSHHHVNGALTIGENIGDLGGLAIALLAYELSLHGEPTPAIDGLTGMQRLFFGWAQVCRTKSRETEAVLRLAVDPHAPPEFRCNGVVRNIADFYDAFGVTADDALYLDPTQRVRIWT